MKIFVCSFMVQFILANHENDVVTNNDVSKDKDLDLHEEINIESFLKPEDLKQYQINLKKEKMKEKLKFAGKRKKRGRVVGGATVNSNQVHPEYASLKTAAGSSFCGATILDSSHILTAAHCVPSPGNKVYAGTVNRDGSGGQKVDIARCTKHPQARKASAVYVYDFEICKLRSPLNLDNRSKKIVTIGTKQEYDSYVVTGKASCVVVGMGRDKSAGKGKSIRSWSPYLKQLKVNISPDFDRGLYSKYMIPNHTGFIAKAAAGIGNGACNGDSGGPLFCTINGVKKQFGVASFADLGCRSISGWYKPGEVMSWIQSTSNHKAGSSTSSGMSNSRPSNSHSSNSRTSNYGTSQPTNSRSSYGGSNSRSNSGSSRVKAELMKYKQQIEKLIRLVNTSL